MAIVEGLRTQDFRYNPISRVFVPETITAEPKTCGLIPNMGGVYGFQLNEIPLKESPSTVVVTRSDLTVFTEVVDTAPIGTEFYVDYHYDTYANRGYVILNASQNGQTFTVAYKGLGSVMSVANTQYIEQAALDSKLSRDGSLPMLGNLNANSNKITNLSNGTVSSDAVNFGQLSSVQNAVNGIQSQKGVYQNLNISSNITITEDRFLYDLVKDSTINGYTANITGCPNIDGTVILIKIGTLGTGNLFVNVHGSPVGLASDSFSIGYAYRTGGTWYGAFN